MMKGMGKKLGSAALVAVVVLWLFVASGICQGSETAAAPVLKGNVYFQGYVRHTGSGSGIPGVRVRLLYYAPPHQPTWVEVDSTTTSASGYFQLHVVLVYGPT